MMARLVIVSALLVIALLGSACRAMTEGEARETIRQHLAAEKGSIGGADICSKYPCCYMDSGDNCALQDMPKLPSTVVFPGGQTRCIFSDSTDYAFQVWPGATDKLLFYFQGGGACWDQSSTSPAPLCYTDISAQETHGVFDREDPTNKFSEYTIVHLMYCSGDMFVGNVVRPYNDSNGVPVTQRGQANARATVQWVQAQQASGALATNFKDLVIMGCSAGSIAAQSWSRELLKTFQHEKAAIVPDSYIGVFPPNSQGALIYNYGACSTDLLPPALQAKCLAQTLTLQEVMTTWLSDSPSIPYSYIQSKVDAVQMSFYYFLALSVGQNPVLTQSQFYSRVNNIMDEYNVYDNFVTYLVDGTQHCYTNFNLYYTATPTSARDGPRGNTTNLEDWVPLLPLSPGDAIDTVCEGPEATLAAARDGTTFCSDQLYPKEFVSPQ